MLEVQFDPDDPTKLLGRLLPSPSQSLQDTLLQSDIVLLPESLSEQGKAVFRPGTRDFFEYVTSHVGGKARLEVASADDDYVEQLLHANEIWLPTLLFLVDNPLVHEIAIVGAAHYVVEKLRGLLKKDRERAVVHAKILVNRRKGTASFTYDGPADSFRAIMTKAIGRGAEESK